MIEYKFRPENEKYTFDDLYEIIRLLRSPEGCPWDRVQTHYSLVTPMIEEAYELVDAIEKDNDEKMTEELGDVLLQVIFHTIIGAEEGRFTFFDVTDGCARKMLYRHSHVFGEDRAADSAEALENWDRRKSTEKGLDTLEQKLYDIPKDYPALYKAFKAASKIRKAGAENKDITPGVEALVPDSEEELGRLLNGIAAAAEAKGLNPENALRRYVDKNVIPAGGDVPADGAEG